MKKVVIIIILATLLPPVFGCASYNSCETCVVNGCVYVQLKDMSNYMCISWEEYPQMLSRRTFRTAQRCTLLHKEKTTMMPDELAKESTTQAFLMSTKESTLFNTHEPATTVFVSTTSSAIIHNREHTQEQTTILPASESTMLPATKKTTPVPMITSTRKHTEENTSILVTYKSTTLLVTRQPAVIIIPDAPPKPSIMVSQKYENKSGSMLVNRTTLLEITTSATDYPQNQPTFTLVEDDKVDVVNTLANKNTSTLLSTELATIVEETLEKNTVNITQKTTVMSTPATTATKRKSSFLDTKFSRKLKAALRRFRLRKMPLVEKQLRRELKRLLCRLGYIFLIYNTTWNLGSQYVQMQTLNPMASPTGMSPECKSFKNIKF